MSSGSAKANEFKRYRQLLVFSSHGALCIGATCAGFLLLTASVLAQPLGDHAHRHANRGQPSSRGLVSRGANGRPDLENLHRCYHDVASVFQELGQKSAPLLALAHLQRSLDSFERTGEWQTVSTSWLRHWESVVGMRCRFVELTEEKLGEAYILRAQLHGALPSLRHHYESLLVAVDRDYLAVITQLAHNLEGANTLLEHAAREEAP